MIISPSLAEPPQPQYVFSARASDSISELGSLKTAYHGYRLAAASALLYPHTQTLLPRRQKLLFRLIAGLIPEILIGGVDDAETAFPIVRSLSHFCLTVVL